MNKAPLTGVPVGVTTNADLPVPWSAETALRQSSTGSEWKSEGPPRSEGVLKRECGSGRVGTPAIWPPPSAGAGKPAPNEVNRHGPRGAGRALFTEPDPLAGTYSHTVKYLASRHQISRFSNSSSLPQQAFKTLRSIRAPVGRGAS